MRTTPVVSDGRVWVDQIEVKMRELIRRIEEQTLSFPKVRDQLQAVIEGRVHVWPPETEPTVSDIFCDEIDYDRSIAEFVRAGNYATVDPGLTDENVISTETGKKMISTKLFHFGFGRLASSVRAENNLNSKGFRPATSKEILNFGQKHPEVQLMFPVVAVGSAIVVGTRRVVCCLRGENGNRQVALVCYMHPWNERCRFLGVKDPYLQQDADATTFATTAKLPDHTSRPGKVDLTESTDGCNCLD